MMNGTFKISMSTPMGMKSGTIKFVDDNGVLSGSIRAMGSENPFNNGKTSETTFEFTSTLDLFFSKIQYNAKGTITGDILQATAETKFGMMQINGTRV
jgi:hypothetical protein